MSDKPSGTISAAKLAEMAGLTESDLRKYTSQIPGFPARVRGAYPLSAITSLLRFAVKGDEAGVPGPGRPRGEASRMPQFDSINQAAAASDVPIAALKLAKKSGCSAFKHGRVDLREFLAWWFKEGTDGEIGIDWSREHKKEQTLRERIKREDEEGEVVKFAEVTRFYDSYIGQKVFGELEQMAQELPRNLKGKDETTIHSTVVERIERLKEGLQSSWQSFLNEQGAK
jgi:hypothetical protein